MLEDLLAYGRAIITETQLQKLTGERDYSLFRGAVEDLVHKGLLVPVKSAGSNGRIPPLYNKYRVLKPKEDFTGYFESIRQLYPALNIPGYLGKPELYGKHRDIVDGLSRYLWYSAELLKEPMSRKERSFSVWGKEKLLDNHFALVQEVLNYNGFTGSFLNYYDTPEPFFEYVHARAKRGCVLILENKDTWFTFRKVMRDTGRNVVAGTPVDVLLYGEGNKISKRGALAQYSDGMLEGTNRPGQFLYFGDLDREGIRLFFRAREANPGLDLRPCADLYLLMLSLAENIELPRSPDERDVPVPLTEFAALLGIEEAGSLVDLFANGRYIPQEIVNYQVAARIMA